MHNYTGSMVNLPHNCLNYTGSMVNLPHVYCNNEILRPNSLELELGMLLSDIYQLTHIPCIQLAHTASLSMHANQGIVPYTTNTFNQWQHLQFSAWGAHAGFPPHAAPPFRLCALLILFFLYLLLHSLHMNGYAPSSLIETGCQEIK